MSFADRQNIGGDGIADAFPAASEHETQLDDFWSTFLAPQATAFAQGATTETHVLTERSEEETAASNPTAIDPAWIVEIQRKEVLGNLTTTNAPESSSLRTAPPNVRPAWGTVMPHIAPANYSSDCSWTTAEDNDDSEDFYSQLRNDLERLCSAEGKDYLLTSALPSRLRRQVHASAKLMGLSHMSVGTDASRKVLVSRHRLCSYPNESSDRSWNYKAAAQDSCELDANVLGFLSWFKRSCMTEEDLTTRLHLSGLPTPSHMWTCSFLYPGDCLSAQFSSAAAAAEVMTAVPQLDLDSSVVVNYTFRKGRPEVYQGQTTSRIARPPTPARSNSTSRGSGFSSDVCYSDASNASFASAMSNDDMLPEYPTVRRRRYPKSKDHYACRAPDCEKAFDRAGDRTKHERIHQQPHTWPHGCDECGKRFIDKKDLVRHAKSCG